MSARGMVATCLASGLALGALVGAFVMSAAASSELDRAQDEHRSLREDERAARVALEEVEERAADVGRDAGEYAQSARTRLEAARRLSELAHSIASTRQQTVDAAREIADALAADDAARYDEAVTAFNVTIDALVTLQSEYDQADLDFLVTGST